MLSTLSFPLRTTRSDPRTMFNTCRTQVEVFEFKKETVSPHSVSGVGDQDMLTVLKLPCMPRLAVPGQIVAHTSLSQSNEMKNVSPIAYREAKSASLKLPIGGGGVCAFQIVSLLGAGESLLLAE
jgi:hypothetical protein